MNIFPPLDARVSALERQQVVQNARIEEIHENMTNDIKQLSDDMKASFKQLAIYQVEMEQHIEARFNQMDERFTQVDERFNQMDERFTQVDVRFDKVETRLDKLETLIIQVLERLPENPQGNK